MEKATFDQYLELGQMIKRGELDRQTVQALIEGRMAARSGETSYTITLDRSMSLGDMIAAGKYDSVNGHITEKKFPIERQEGKSEVEVILVHFDKVLTTTQVKSEFERRGLQPAKIENLLALGTAHPDLQRDFPIAALGSALQPSGGDLDSPYLGGDGDERDLDLDWYNPDVEWDGYWRFLAVRK